MRNVIIYLFALLLLTGALSAQRLSSGININSPAIGFVKYEQQYYSPDNLSRIYFVNEPGKKGRKFAVAPFNPKWHARIGIGLGYILRLDYKQLAVRTGIQFSYQYTTLKFQEFSYDAEVDQFKQDFYMSSLSVNFPLIFSIDLKRKNNSWICLFGTEYGYYTAMNDRIDNLSYNQDFLNFMYGIYYNEIPWVNADLGIGKKWKYLEWYAMYKYRVDGGKKNLSIKSSYIEANVNFYLGYNSVRRKHYIYREND